MPIPASSHAAPCPTQHAHRPGNSPLCARRRHRRAAARLAMIHRPSMNPRHSLQSLRTSYRVESAWLSSTRSTTTLLRYSATPRHSLQCASVCICVCVDCRCVCMCEPLLNGVESKLSVHVLLTKHIMTDANLPRHCWLSQIPRSKHALS